MGFKFEGSRETLRVLWQKVQRICEKVGKIGYFPRTSFLASITTGPDRRHLPPLDSFAHCLVVNTTQAMNSSASIPEIASF